MDTGMAWAAGTFLCAVPANRPICAALLPRPLPCLTLATCAHCLQDEKSRR